MVNTEYPCDGWSDVEIPQQRMIVETEDGEVVSRVYRSTVTVTGHTEAVTRPPLRYRTGQLSLVEVTVSVGGYKAGHLILSPSLGVASPSVSTIVLCCGIST